MHLKVKHQKKGFAAYFHIIHPIVRQFWQTSGERSRFGTIWLMKADNLACNYFQHHPPIFESHLLSSPPLSLLPQIDNCAEFSFHAGRVLSQLALYALNTISCISKCIAQTLSLPFSLFIILHRVCKLSGTLPSKLSAFKSIVCKGENFAFEMNLQLAPLQSE